MKTLALLVLALLLTGCADDAPPPPASDYCQTEDAAMSRYDLRQSSFGGGEISPRSLGRADLPQYLQSGALVENWLIHQQGSLARRPGFGHVGVCKTIDPFVSVERASSTGDYDLYGLAYGAELGRWVGVGQSNGTEPVIVYSDDDGVTWTAASSVPNLNAPLHGAAWSGSRFVVVGSLVGGNTTIMYSADGDTWIDASTALTGTPTLVDVVWMGNLFVAVGVASDIVVTSPTGATWTERSTTYGGKAVARSTDSGNLITSGTATAVSTDGGLTWGTLGHPTGYAVNGVIYSGGFYYLGSNATAGGAGSIHRGTGDGTWTQVYLNGSGSTAVFYLAEFGDYLVGVGQGGLLVYSIDDGATWTTSAIEAVNLHECFTGNGTLVIVGESDGTDAQLFTLSVNATKRRLI
ncbi:hypothetical protein LCGC14_2607530, partial [marine sediment metagenome]